MRELTKAALAGANLVPIQEADMVRRYRECMERLGLTPTKCRKFKIDGRGWSFEIADEMDDPDYLSHGGAANPLGIIVDINQRHSPVYTPAHSFDRVMMQDYFRVNRAAIADITTETGIALDIDQRMTWYRTLDNICQVRSVHIISDAGSLAQNASEQTAMVHRFMDSESIDWMQTDLRQGIIKSFREHGQLYKRNLIIGEHIFSGFNDFYTKALGGVYVFRHSGTLALVVVVDPKQKKNASKELQPNVVSLSDKNVVDRIRDAFVADIDFGWYRNHPEVLQSRIETLGLFLLSSVDGDMPVDTLRPAQVTGELRKCSNEAVAQYAELEEVAARIASGEDQIEMSSEVASYLLHPVFTTSRYEENLVWQLICQVQPWPVDVMRLYAVDKNLFMEKYGTWSKPMRAWVRTQIASYDSKRTYEEQGQTVR